MPLESQSPFGPTTSEAIDRFEEAHDVDVPEEYRRFLLASNGATPAGGQIPVPELGQEVVVQILLGLHNGPSYASLESEVERCRFVLPHWLPIGYEEGGNPILIGLHGKDRGRVVLWDQSLDQVTSTESPTMYSLAPDLVSFLGGL